MPRKKKVILGERFREEAGKQKEASGKYVRTVPVMRRGIYQAAVNGEASPRGAIKANCHFCCGYENLGMRVGGCQVYTCPLWRYRPYQDYLDKNIKSDDEVET